MASKGIQYSVTIGVENTTIADIQAAATAVNAADDARVSIGGYYQSDPNSEGKPYTITFSWAE